MFICCMAGRVPSGGTQGVAEVALPANAKRQVFSVREDSSQTARQRAIRTSAERGRMLVGTLDVPSAAVRTISCWYWNIAQVAQDAQDAQEGHAGGRPPLLC
jgi:hypothetical protein